ncbi:MAG: hypothetical protein HY294_13825 [Candidatus Rokubacteria bacterium]|nr:hypothetical protein [Candidatus Rokubacteria bacterium]
MLTEEALILFAFLAGCMLLVLGTLELVWPTRSRHPDRHPYPPITSLQRRGRSGARRGHRAGAVPEPIPGPAPPVTAPSEAEEFAPADARVVAQDTTAVPVDESLVAAETQPPPLPGVGTLPSESAPPIVPAPPAAGGAVERCFALYQDQRFAEVIEEAATALQPGPPFFNDVPASQYAALTGLIGLARQALGDREGARAALVDAVNRAPGGDRATWARHLGALMLATGRDLIARAEAESDERVAALRQAIDWLEVGRASLPGDAVIADTLAAARTALWPAYEHAINELLQRQDFEAGRAVILEALAEPALPPERRAAFQEQFGTTFSGQVGQLTADAIRSMHDEKESEALAALAQAESLLASMPGDGMPDVRRAELDRRLWWGYTTVGMRRIEAEQFEAALEPLTRALRFTSVGEQRRDETRGALVRALDGLTDDRLAVIREIATEGRHDDALVEADKVWALLRSSLDLGLAEEEIASALDRLQRLFKELGRK